MDLLTVNHLHKIHFELTTNCNLKCTYCAVSQPTYRGQDLKVERYGRLVQDFIKYKPDYIQFNGHGETTMIPGWEKRAQKLLDNNLQLSICSNFALVYTEEQLRTLARFGTVTASCDTVDHNLFKKMRRGGDYRTLLYNWNKIRQYAIEIGKRPYFIWSCVLCDLNIWGLREFVREGAMLGVNCFCFCNIRVYNTPPGGTPLRHLANMNEEETIKAIEILNDVLKIGRELNVVIDLKGGIIECLQEKIHSK